jgi:hypothetical protein
VAALSGRIAAAWRTWHTSLHRRSGVGAVLSALLTDCQDAALLLDGPDRGAAHAVLADAYHLAQHMLVSAAEPELLWLVVDRGMTAAYLTRSDPSWTSAKTRTGRPRRSGCPNGQSICL